MDTVKYDLICKAYWEIWNRTQSDPEYARLRAELAALETQYEAITQDLPEAQREIIERYITLRESMNRRMLECACEELLFGAT